MYADDVLSGYAERLLVHRRVVVSRQTRPVSVVERIRHRRRSVDHRQVVRRHRLDGGDGRRRIDGDHLEIEQRNRNLVDADVVEGTAHEQNVARAGRVAVDGEDGRRSRALTRTKAVAAAGQAGVAKAPAKTLGRADDRDEVVRIVGAGGCGEHARQFVLQIATQKGALSYENCQ